MPIIVAILGIIIVALGAAFFLIPGTDTSVATPEPVAKTTVVTETLPSNNPTVDTPAVKNLKGEATYLTPERTPHKVTVELTMTGDIVTDSNVLYNDKETYSDPNQERFDQAYKTEVVGKTLSQISLSRVGGASLTTNAFNEALAKIITAQS